jgi:hypothetical protein
MSVQVANAAPLTTSRPFVIRGHGELVAQPVAHVGPAETVRVTLEYEEPLACDGARCRLRFPLAAAPRYVPAVAKANLQGGEVAAPERAPRAGVEDADARLGGPMNPVDVAVLIDQGGEIADVTSSYGGAALQKAGDGRVGVMLVTEQDEADRDFELSWSVHAASVARHQEPGSPAPATAQPAAVGALWANAETGTLRPAVLRVAGEETAGARGKADDGWIGLSLGFVALCAAVSVALVGLRCGHS